MVKNITGFLLLALVIAISVVGYLDEKANSDVNHIEVNTEEPEQDETETLGYSGPLVEEYTRPNTVVPIDNFDVVDNYLDPHEKQNYEDLLTVYSSYLPMAITDDPEQFFEDNRDNINNVLGIYFLDEFISLNQKLKNSGLANNSVLEKVEIVDLETKGRLLNAHIRVLYDEATLDMSHNLDYVYIGTEAYLFLYSDGGDA